MATLGPRVQRLHRCRPHRPAGDLIIDQLAYETLKECPDAATLLDEIDGWTRSNYDPNLQMEYVWKADFDESQYIYIYIVCQEITTTNKRSRK